MIVFRKLPTYGGDLNGRGRNLTSYEVIRDGVMIGHVHSCFERRNPRKRWTAVTITGHEFQWSARTRDEAAGWISTAVPS